MSSASLIFLNRARDVLPPCLFLIIAHTGIDCKSFLKKISRGVLFSEKEVDNEEKAGYNHSAGKRNDFHTGSLTVSIGAMAMVGAIQDGISNDYSTLALKAVLDFIIVMVMSSSMGKGCAFSAIPVFVFEGTITMLSRLISPIMTELAISYLSLIGSILIFCVGVNLIWGGRIRVANMLPAVVLAILAAYLPFTL